MRLLLPFMVVLFTIVSCSSKEEPLTKDEAIALSHAIDSAIRNKKANYFNSLVNETAFINKVSKLSGKKTSAAMRSGIREALRKSDLGYKIVEAVHSNGTYELVKHYEKNNIHHLVFRLYSDVGLNYHDFELVKSKGKPSISDIFIYLSGEELSKTISDLMTTFSDGAGDVSDEKWAQVEKVRKMKELIERNQHESAVKYFETLPPDFKNQRSIRIMHILACSQLDQDKHMQAINEYLALYPNEPNMHLMMVDTYILRKEYDKALESINKLDNVINKDPFLDYFRGLMYNLMEKPAEARMHLEKLHENMPGFGAGVLELIANYITEGDDDKARNLIKEYEKNKSFDQALLDNYLEINPAFSREE